MKKILVACPSETDFQQIRNMLIYAGHQLVHCINLSDVSLLAQAQKPDVVLVDFYWSGQSFFSVMRQIKSCPVASLIPIICMSPDAQTQNHVALTLGASKHISKPLNMNELLNSIQSI